MAFERMDATVIRDVASKLDAQVATIGDVITALQGTVTRSQQSWRGADQSRFSSSWSAQHQPALASAHATLSGLATLHPDDVSQGQNGNGTTTVTLYDNGHPVPVTVTNAIPTDNGSNVGVTSTDGNNWPQIYEKAYAQNRGGYGTIDQGRWGRDGLSAITGQPVQFEQCRRPGRHRPHPRPDRAPRICRAACQPRRNGHAAESVGSVRPADHAVGHHPEAVLGSRLDEDPLHSFRNAQITLDSVTATGCSSTAVLPAT